ncbi:hypothetical protein CSOJ01_11499 [Colletotrichum sojae]|uniref:Uncharacterized protein n=1 Tax=Colletotrichum sojae TaxID=2175907 RepID=A0A8H6IXA4_9PEZI|nr:hypothetical protein CSOJ01_11499 [Colletotrichum sojae]
MEGGVDAAVDDDVRMLSERGSGAEDPRLALRVASPATPVGPCRPSLNNLNEEVAVISNPAGSTPPSLVRELRFKYVSFAADDDGWQVVDRGIQRDGDK